MLTVDIRKRFTGFTLNVQLEAAVGVTALLGASASGKSVTLQCIAGVMRPDSGVIYRDGKPLFDKKRSIDLPPQKRRVGLCFQHGALFPNMTLLQNVEAGLASRVRGRAERRIRALALMESFRLENAQALYPRQLSGGQQQRAALCRVLASEPETLLLDEPFAALDSHLKWQLEREMMDVLREFAGEVLLVTHDRGEAFRLSQHACVLDGGRSESLLPTEELFTEPRSRNAAILSGCQNVAAASRLDGHRLCVPEWGGASLATTARIPPGLRYIGIRADRLRFGDKGEENALSARVERVIRDIRSTSYTCAVGGGVVCVEDMGMAANALKPGERACVIVEKDAIMLLES